MASQYFSGLAAFIALTFLVMALIGCSSSEQARRGPIDIASYDKPPGTPEFHGAPIGADALRGELQSEN